MTKNKILIPKFYEKFSLVHKTFVLKYDFLPFRGKIF